MATNRTSNFTFRVNPDERQLLAAVAEQLGISESDVARYSVRKTARELGMTIPTEPDRKEAEHDQLAGG